MILENDKSKRRTNITNQTPYAGLGKLPPQSVDIEEAVLGSLMLERVNENIWSMVNSDMFYKDNHQKIFKAISNIKNSHKPIDILTVTAELRSSGELEMIGGAYYLTELTNRVVSAANIEFHLMIIHQKFMQREVIRISQMAINNGYDDTEDVFDLMDFVVNSISDLKKGISSNKGKNAIELAKDLRNDLLKPKLKGMLGPGTGIRGVDVILKGDAPGDVRLIEGATSMGKSALACSEVINCCFDYDQQGNPRLKDEQVGIAVFNLEMTSLKYSIRLMANLTSIDKDIISLNTFSDLERDRYHHFLNMFEQSEIYIDDCEDGITINQFEFRVADLVEKYGIQKVVIDTVQLMRPDPALMRINNTRELQLADNSRRVKACAKKNHIAIIEVAQLNDEVRKAKNCMPTLGMVRECKAIEHDADNVMFIWRPEYYEELVENLSVVNCNQFGFSINDFKNVAFLIIAKNREGIRCKIPVKFRGDIMRIYDHPKVLDSLNSFQGDFFKISDDGVNRDAPF
jgi:replicative DNA helicase